MLAGLLHDVGLAAMRYVSTEVSVVYDRLLQGGCPATYAETVLLGWDHGEIGAEILAGWNFADRLIQAVRWHHQPERSQEKVAGLLYLSEYWDCSEEDLPSSIRLLSAVEMTGLTLDRLRSIEAEWPPQEEDVLTVVLAA